MQFDWWTLAIQTVNVAVLVWLLQRFFWRPVSAIIEQRRTTTEAALAQAKATDAKAAAALADVEKARAGFAAEREGILQQAHEAARQADAATLAATATKVAALEAAGTAAIADGEKASAQGWAERSTDLAVDIAGHLAARLDGGEVQARFLAWLLVQLRALPEAARLATDGAPLEAVSATPLDAAARAHVLAEIATALGTVPTVTFRTDSALIAGLELKGAHLAVSNSWRADLQKIREGARHDDRG